MGDVIEIQQAAGITIVGTLHDPEATAGQVLTVQSDKSIKAAAGGGGVQVATVHVTSAQIKALKETPVVLVPGVVGSVTVATGVGIVYDAGATPYTDNGGNIEVHTLATTPGLDVVWTTQGVANFLDQSASQVFLAPYMAGPSSGQVGILSDLVARDVILVQTVADPTLGNGTLVVTVSYFLAPTV